MYGLDSIEKNYVLPYILGENFDGISEWVGSAPDEIMVEKGLHTISGGINEKRDIAVRIKLFDLWNTPEYVVIVGKANLNSLKVPIKSESDHFYRPY